ncbi:alpha/beta hydrolase [Tropicimonas sp. TH_r6]|uniref:alpha/beta fold hydrolase n=1 Tax=Tropicimonas sp. TH_r6 TaxID=3082085 RepID=UPI002952FAA8|nr:alpha/beta hydrolase [Tropicimonas sp. TH_r6]MDV7142394.1 alpha/beta hydrolase [Tropicimonas sp. TH_r6]
MSTPRFCFVPILDHEIHVALWGDPSNPPLVMWHGLARTGRDFDELAAALSDTFFILCPDTIGRGLSSWSDTPEAEYSIEFYAAIAAGLLDHFEIAQTGWIGTSMGGLIAMRMASGALADRLSWMILNDIGPEIPQAAIDRILAYADEQPTFACLSEAEAWFRAAYTPFGPADDGFWTRMARCSVRRRSDGTFTTHFDPRITIQFLASAEELTSWDRYERIRIPTHLIRGAASDLLPAATAARMQASGPHPGKTEIEDCGHAPSLSRRQDARLIRETITELRARPPRR